jgi:AraC family transcriptional regulator, ethanolamine operon transcriptional activator
MSVIPVAYESARLSVVRDPCGSDVHKRSSRRIPRQQLVARVMEFLRENISEPVTVAELSRIAGVSERTLRAAFHDVIGLSPKQYAISGRLRAAHAALTAADPETTTVTDIAMTYGFFELGRFAERYRHTFGEVPSRTLRHSAVSQPEQAA